MTAMQHVEGRPEHRKRLNEAALDQLFREARTHAAWLPQPVSEEILHDIYDCARWGPTSANISPLRIVFLKGEEAKERLRPALMELNVEKTMKAPVVAIFAQDMEFYEQLPKLMPYRDIRSWFVGQPALIEESAFRNSTLQAAYFMLAARAHGLDCGPMSGFNAEKVNAEFFPEGKWKVNFLCNLGYGDHAKLNPRLPRLDFDEACRVL